MTMLEARVDRLEAALQRLIEAQAQTQAELRALTEAQRRTEERLEALTIRFDQLSAHVDRLTLRFDQLSAHVDDLTIRLDQLTAHVDQLTTHVGDLTMRLDQLTTRVDQLTTHVDQLALAQARTEERLHELAVVVQRLTERMDHLTDIVGGLRGESVERRYRERAAAYFDDLLRAIHPVSLAELAQILDDAQSRGILSREERKDLLSVDVIVRGRRWEDDTEAYLVAEASAVIDSGDVQRAARRAELLERIVGMPVIAVVAGETIIPEAQQAAKTLRVWRVLDGKALPPNG